MSFILQKVSSSDQLLASQQKVPSTNELFSFKKPSLKNAKQLSQIQSKSILFKILLTFIHSFLIICTFLLTKFEQAEQQLILHYFSTLFAACSVVVYIFVNLNEQRLKNKVQNKQKTTIQSVVLKIIFLLSCIAHPNQLTNNVYIQLNSFNYKLNELLSIIVCLRIFNLIVFCIQFSRFYGLRVARLADLYSNQDKLSLKFAIKCLYKQKGLKMPIFMLFIGLIIICFIDVNFQRATNLSTNFLESLYDSVITMTTVGYGEIGHEEKFERMKAITLVIIGSFISSVLTLTILNFCKFTQEEAKAYITLKRLNLKEELALSTKTLLKSVISKKNRDNTSNYEQKQLIITKKMKQYKAELNEFYWSDTLRNFYIKKNSTFHSGIKKIVQKQLIIKTLMNFFISRRMLIEEEIVIQSKDNQEVKTPKSANSNKSNKRKEDSRKMLAVWQKILQDQVTTKKGYKQQ